MIRLMRRSFFASSTPYVESRNPAILLSWVSFIVRRDHVVGDIERRFEADHGAGLHYTIEAFFVRDLLHDFQHPRLRAGENFRAVAFHVGAQILVQTLHFALLALSAGRQI